MSLLSRPARFISVLQARNPPTRTTGKHELHTTCNPTQRTYSRLVVCLSQQRHIHLRGVRISSSLNGTRYGTIPINWHRSRRQPPRDWTFISLYRIKLVHISLACAEFIAADLSVVSHIFATLCVNALPAQCRGMHRLRLNIWTLASETDIYICVNLFYSSAQIE